MRNFIILVLSVVFIAGLVYSEDPTYIGVKKCRMCHKGEKKGNVYETWNSKKHSTAFEAVKQKGEEKNPKCLACHATGFNKGGYKIDDPDASKFEGVQCESCHGPGSLYKKTSIMKDRAKALENGLVDINEKTCAGCHDGSEHAGGKFNYEEALKKIDHTYTKK
jgi:hypothetical protein